MLKARSSVRLFCLGLNMIKLDFLTLIDSLFVYPFRKSKGLFSRGFILVTNLLVDVLVKKSVALCQCIIRKS